MPWRETCPMNQRQKFIEEWLHNEWSFSALCQAYGVSRKTGYKWLDRFKNGGFEDLGDQPRACETHPNATPASIEARIVQLAPSIPILGPTKAQEAAGNAAPGSNLAGQQHDRQHSEAAWLGEAETQAQPHADL